MNIHTEMAHDDDPYTRFLRAYFRSVYDWCLHNGSEPGHAVIAAQRIVLDLYRMEHGMEAAA